MNDVVELRTRGRRSDWLRILVVALAPLMPMCGGEDNPAVPKAQCGASDRVEPGLQGQTSLADRQSGASQTAYNCNL